MTQDPVAPPNEDHTLNEAIQASLQDLKEDSDVSPFKNSIREGNRCVFCIRVFSLFVTWLLAPSPFALRCRPPASAALVSATYLSSNLCIQVLQALFYVPQVRATVSNLRLPNFDECTQLGDPGAEIS